MIRPAELECMADCCDLSVVIPALNEGANLKILLPELRNVLDDFGIRYEILVITHQADRETREATVQSGAQMIAQNERGYGGALLTGFAAARGTYVLTMDADISHRPVFVRDLWAGRQAAEVTIASRYAAGGRARMPVGRYRLSRVLNVFFHRGLSLPIHDLSSGFRLYRAEVVKAQSLAARDFDILPEILVRAYIAGWRVQEIPFEYVPRRHGSSNARIFRFGLAYLRTFWSLWKLRNSILAADYDDRAYDGPIFLQRYWQRRRFRHITDLIAGQGPVLDVGCGSSRIISALPARSVALDILSAKLRYAHKFSRPLVQGSGCHLPFPDSAFPCVLCSQVIEHVARDSPILDELCRVLAPGGRLVLGTPDYDRWEWVIIEKLYRFFAPGAYADEHITYYNRRGLIDFFTNRRFMLESVRYILRGELILAFRKPRLGV